MSVPLISDVKKIINHSIESPRGKKIVARCVSRYSTPRTFPQKLSYIARRIENAFKSIFHRSDWQLAEGVMRASIKQKVHFSSILPDHYQDRVADQQEIDQLHKSTVNKFAVSASKIVLNGLVKLNNGEKTQQQMKSSVQKKIDSSQKEFTAKLQKLYK